MRASHIICVVAFATPAIALGQTFEVDEKGRILGGEPIAGEETEFDYTFIEGGFTQANFATPSGGNPALNRPGDLDGESSDMGLSGAIQYAFHPNFFVRGSGFGATFDDRNFIGDGDWDIQEWKFGAGFNFALQDDMDVFTRVDGVWQRVDNNFDFQDGTYGAGVELGLRFNVSSWFELATRGGRVFADEIKKNRGPGQPRGTPRNAVGLTNEAEFPGSYTYITGEGLFHINEYVALLVQGELRDEDWLGTTGVRLSM